MNFTNACLPQDALKLNEIIYPCPNRPVPVVMDPVAGKRGAAAAVEEPRVRPELTVVAGRLAVLVVSEPKGEAETVEVAVDGKVSGAAAPIVEVADTSAGFGAKLNGGAAEVTRLFFIEVSGCESLLP